MTSTFVGGEAGAQAAIGLEQQTHPLQTLPPIQNSLKESEKVSWTFIRESPCPSPSATGLEVFLKMFRLLPPKGSFSSKLAGA